MKEYRLHSNIDMNFKNRLNQSMMMESRIAVILGVCVWGGVGGGGEWWGLALTRMEHKETWMLESSISWSGWWLCRCVLFLKFIDLCILLYYTSEEGRREEGEEDEEEEDWPTAGSAHQWVQPETLSVVSQTNAKQFTIFKATSSETIKAKRRDSCFFPSSDLFI